jgi:uncharacterized protein YaiI (UPF0178 family)
VMDEIATDKSQTAGDDQVLQRISSQSMVITSDIVGR